tara:strand:+ start:519 stop:719 length:201 start_codon:yes stop_codon:yes gene_type:complete
MNKDMDLVKGNGWKCEIVITCDDGDSLGNALQSIIDDLGHGMTNNDSASDDFAYKFKLDTTEDNDE